MRSARKSDSVQPVLTAHSHILEFHHRLRSALKHKVVNSGNFESESVCGEERRNARLQASLIVCTFSLRLTQLRRLDSTSGTPTLATADSIDHGWRSRVDTSRERHR